MQCNLVDTSVYRSYDLTGGTVSILMTCHQVSQIIMPEISLESVAYSHLQNLVDRII